MVGVKSLAMAIRGPGASDGLVGKCHRGFVVTGALGQRQGPFLGSIERFPCFWASFAASSADRAP